MFPLVEGEKPFEWRFHHPPRGSDVFLDVGQMYGEAFHVHVPNSGAAKKCARYYSELMEEGRPLKDNQLVASPLGDWKGVNGWLVRKK